MPRGPGKKENYNLDYSRFAGLDRLDDQEGHVVASASNDESGPPPEFEREMQQAMSQVPPELREAFQLMSLAKSTGNMEAQQRANELALKAVERGGPEVKEKFMEEVARTSPEAVEILSGKTGKKPAAEAIGDLNKKGVGTLEESMRKGQEQARKQLEELQKHEEQLNKLKTPEDFFKFFQGGGMREEDLQRMFAGDEKHMQECMQKMLNGVASSELDEKVRKDAEAAVKAVDDVHGALHGDTPEGPGQDLCAAPRVAAHKQPEETPEVRIPEHRLQYRRDATGRYEAVELRCDLPGVVDMGAVELDVNERHLRLVTSAPGPLFAVNVGPFPVLVDASAARAKFSKKRQELVISVPALAS